MILLNIKEFLGRNKKILYYISLFFIVSFLISDVTFANEEETVKSITTWANATLGVISVFTGLITYLATMFLSPEWINGSLFGMNTKFKIVWIMVSNIVYFVFAFILIWIAFMNIIGKNTDQYQLKQALPKFIVGVLLVPFSWFLVQFILSISAILTVSALTLPYDSFPKYANAVNFLKVPTKCTIDLTSKDKDGTKTQENNKNDKNNPYKGEFYDCGKKDDRIPLGSVIAGGDSSSAIYGVLSFYTHGVTGISDADSIKFNTVGVRTLADVSLKLVFDFLFLIIYFILIIALGLVLMIRGIYIWIYIMLSPVFGLMYFFDKKEGGDGFFSKFNLKEFIALAMVPVYTMLALSFGMLFIFVVGSGLTGNQGNVNTNSIHIKKGDKDGYTDLIIGNKDADNKNFTLSLKGALGTNSEEMSSFIKGSGEGVLGYIGHLILKLFGIVILWGTVMAAMRTSEITKTVVEPLHQFGTKIGSIASSAPGHIPIFGGVSATGLNQFGTDFKSNIDQKSIKTGQKLNKKFGLGNADTSGSLATLGQKLGQNNKDKATVNAFRDAMEKLQTVEGMKSDTRFKSYVGEMAKLYGVKDEYVKDLSSTSGMTKAILAIDKELDITKTYGSILSKDNKAIGINPAPTTTSEINNDLKGNISQDNNNNNNNSKKPSLDESGVNTVLQIGNSKLKVEINDGKIDDLLNAKDELAKYVANNLLNTTQLNELISDLNLSDDAVAQLKQYFKKDNEGHIIFTNAGDGNMNVTDFAKSNDS